MSQAPPGPQRVRVGAGPDRDARGRFAASGGPSPGRLRRGAAQDPMDDAGAFDDEPAGPRAANAGDAPEEGGGHRAAEADGASRRGQGEKGAGKGLESPLRHPTMRANIGSPGSEPQLPQTWAEFGEMMWGIMAGKGKGKGHGGGQHLQVKPEPPPGFDGTHPPYEEWAKRLLNWETRFPFLQNRGSLLVGALKGEPFKLVTEKLTPDEYSEEATYDDYGFEVYGGGYSLVKDMLRERYQKRRIIRIFDKALQLFSTRRRGRSTRAFLQDFELRCLETEKIGLKMSEEMKGILAVMFADLQPQERTQVLSQMQAKADQNSQGDSSAENDGVSFPEVAAILQTIGDSASLGGSRPRQALLGLQEDYSQDADEIAEEDMDFEPDESFWDDEMVHAEDDDTLTALVAQRIEGKSVDEIATLFTKAKGRGRGRGRGRGGTGGKGLGAGRGQPKKEAAEKCSHCHRPGHGPDKCWVLHPELVPEKMKARWEKIQKNRENKKGGKATYHVTNSMLTSFTQLTASAPTCALADTGAEGDILVAGSKWVGGFCQRLKALDAPKVRQVVPSHNSYRFGAGARTAQKTLKLPIRWNGSWKIVTTDVVPGNLPALLGYDLQAEMGVVTAPCKDKLYQLTDDAETSLTLREVESKKVGGLIGLDLLAGALQTPVVKATLEVEKASREAAGNSGATALLCSDSANHELVAGTKPAVGTTRVVPEESALGGAPQNAAFSTAGCAPEGDHQAGNALGGAPQSSAILSAGCAPVGGHQANLAADATEVDRRAGGGECTKTSATVVDSLVETYNMSEASDNEHENAFTSQRDADAEEQYFPSTTNALPAAKTHPCLSLSKAELTKLHKAGHVPAERLLTYLLRSNSTPVSDEDRKALLEKLKEIVAGCAGCQLHGPKPMAPGAKLRDLPAFNEEVIFDLVQLRSGIWVFSIMCRGTKYKKYSAMPDSRAYTAARIFIRDWTRHFGMPRKLGFPDDSGSSLHDRGSEFIGSDFLAQLDSMIVLNSATPAYSPESHGDVERANRTLLEALRDTPVRTVNEGDVVCSTAENVLNNTLDHGAGFTSSQLAFGRSTDMFRNLFTDSPASAMATERASDQMRRLMGLQDIARQKTMEVIYSRQIRLALAQRTRPQLDVDLTALKHGDWLLYWRPRTHKAEAAWRGPARYIGHTPWCVYLDHGGAHISAHPSAIRLARGELAVPSQCPNHDPIERERLERDEPQVPVPDAGGDDSGVFVPFQAPNQRPEKATAETPHASSSVDVERHASDSLEIGDEPEPTGLPAAETAEEVPRIQDELEGHELDYPEPPPDTDLPVMPRVELPESPVVEVPVSEDAVEEPAHGEPPAVNSEAASPRVRDLPLPRTNMVRDIRQNAADYASFAPTYGPARAPPGAAGRLHRSGRVYVSKPVKGDRSHVRRYMDYLHDPSSSLSYAKRGHHAMEMDDVPWRRQRRTTADEYYAILAAESQKWASSGTQRVDAWEALTPAEQLFPKQEHYKTWRKHQIFNEVVTKLPSDAVVMDGRWTGKVTEKHPKGKARYTPRGFKDQEKHLYRTDSPTVGFSTMLSAEVWSQHKWHVDGKVCASAVLDVSDAFYQGEKISRTNVYVLCPDEWHEMLVRDGLLPELPPPGAKVYLHLQKDAPGLATGPRSWYLALDSWLRDYVVSFKDIDSTSKSEHRLEIGRTRKPALYAIHERDPKGRFVRTYGYIGTHVDDLRFRARGLVVDGRSVIKSIVAHIEAKFEVGHLELSDGEGRLRAEYLGYMIETTPEGVYVDQSKYIRDALQSMELPAKARKADQKPVDSTLQGKYATVNGQLQWVVTSRPEVGCGASKAASLAKNPSVQACIQLKEIIEYVESTADYRRFLPTLSSLNVRAYADASLGNAENERTQGGRLVTCEDERGKAACIVARSGSLKRVANSSFDAESISSVDVASEAVAVSLVLEELENGPTSTLLSDVLARETCSGNPQSNRVLGPYAPDLYTDGMGTVRSVAGTGELKSKRRAIDIALLREAVDLGDLGGVYHIDGQKNPCDPLTKAANQCKATMPILVRLLYSGLSPLH